MPKATQDSDSALPTPSSDDLIFSEETELERTLGFTESFSIIVGRIIGSGIFRTPGPMMLAVGSVSLFYGSWIIGGIATILGAILYAEMAAMMPRSGGPYAYLKAAYPPIWTFLRGWAMFFVSETASIAAVALVFSEYAASLLQAALGIQESMIIQTITALSIIWVLTASNLFGVFFSGLLQNLFSFMKIFALFAIVAASFGGHGGSYTYFTMRFRPQLDGWESLLAVGTALRYGFFAYSGWEGATYIAEEIKNPRRNLPLSLFTGISGVMLLYMGVNSAYLYQLSVPDFIHAENAKRLIAAEAMERALGTTGVVLISVSVMLSTFGNVGAQILVKARTWYAMSRDGLFIESLSTIDPVYHTPNRALLAQGLWASVLLLGATFAGRAYETIIDFFSFTSTVFNISTFAAIVVLRKKYPHVARPYRAWAFPFTFAVVMTIQIVFAAITLYTAFWPSLLGILLTTTGLLYYYRESIVAFYKSYIRIS